MNKNDIICSSGNKNIYTQSFNASEEFNEEPVVMTGENVSFNSENDYSKKEIVRLIRKNINIAIADKNNINDEQFKMYQIEIMIKNFNCHLNSIFHDINLNLPDEFLKRLYSTKESAERIPKISNYYKNYLKFFCNPMFRNFAVNKLIQIYGDNKAELYYKNNYGGSKKKSEDEVKDYSKSQVDEIDGNKNNNIFSDSVKDRISHNSITQTAIHYENNSTLYLDEDIKNNRINKNNSPRFQDVSHFTCNSIIKTHRDDSIINDLVNNLDKNTIENSINDRIIDKLHKNKRIYNNPSTTDKTKDDKTKKSSSIIRQFVNEPKNEGTYIYSSTRSNNDQLITQMNIFKLNHNKQPSKDLIENSKNFNRNMIRNESTKNIAASKGLILSSILNKNIKSPLLFPKGKNQSIKNKVIDNDLNCNLKSPTSIMHKYLHMQTRLTEYKNFKITKPKHLEYQSKKITSNEMKKSITNQSGSNNVYSAKCVTPSLNLVGNLSNNTPNVNDLVLKEKGLSSKTISDNKTRNKQELRLDNYLVTEVISEEKVAVKKKNKLEKLHTKSFSKDSFYNKTISSNKHSTQIFIKSKMSIDDKVKKVTLSLYNKQIPDITSSKSPSFLEFDKFSQAKDSKNNLNLHISRIKSPKEKPSETKNKSYSKEQLVSLFKPNNHPLVLSFHSRNKTENFQTVSFQTLQNLDKMKTPKKMMMSKINISKNTVDKIFGSCLNLQYSQNKSMMTLKKVENKVSKVSSKGDSLKSPKSSQNYSSRIPKKSINKSLIGSNISNNIPKTHYSQNEITLKDISSKKTRLVKFK